MSGIFSHGEKICNRKVFFYYESQRPACILSPTFVFSNIFSALVRIQLTFPRTSEEEDWP